MDEIPASRGSFFVLILAEVERARSKFPSPDLLLTALSEEYGEAVQSVLNHYSGKGDEEAIRKELIQCGAMVYRLATEGDPIHRLPPLFAEPAPSSEKALREALRLLELWYTWQAEATEVRMADNDYLNIVTPTAALLASSPASVIPRPEDVKRPGPRAPSSVNPGPCNTVASAPEAPK